MNIIFISGVELGLHALRGVLDSTSYHNGEATVQAVFGLALDKAGRTSGYQSFDEVTHQANIPLHTIASIKSEAVIGQIRDYAPDLLCIIGWSQIAPNELLDIPKEKHGSDQRHGAHHGCVGIHPTLLPKGRGRAPIPWSILKGLQKSGVSLFCLEEEVDAGDILAQREFEITLEDDAATIYAKVARLHYEIMRDTVPLLVNGTAPRVPQDPHQVTMWEKRTPKDGVIDWNKPHWDQYNWIRALTRPYPGAFTFWKGRKLIVWKSRFTPQKMASPGALATPGTIVEISDNGIGVACADGALILQRVQFEDEPEFEARDFACHYGLELGDSFSGAPTSPASTD